MPIDYSKYPQNWKSEIVPDILKRAGNCCEVCKVPNKIHIYRGYLEASEIEVYQTADGCIYDADNGKKLLENGFVIPLSKRVKDVGKVIQVVLTIAHLDHDIANNDYSNLKAMCQLHHLRFDKDRHAQTRKANKEKLQSKLF